MNCLRNLTAVVALASLTGLASAASYTGLYVFGDSLSDTGNIAAAIGSNAGQVIANNGYIPSQPYASGQFTNGDVWVKSFAEMIGLAPYATATLNGGANFAFGGARTSTDGTGLPPSLTTQTGQFLTATHGYAPGGALYVVAGGGNDARDALQAAATAATDAGRAAAITAAATAYAVNTGAIVDRLQAAGARNIIVWDVPNLALAPAVQIQGAGATFLGGAVSAAMNGALAARLNGEAGVTLFDLYGIQGQIYANPSAYGLSNVSDACGAVANCNASTYLYWDGIHPTAAGHALLARQMFITAVPEPGTWALFVGGLLVVGLRSRKRALASWGR
jgi:outer membrane lipase/esterase